MVKLLVKIFHQKNKIMLDKDLNNLKALTDPKPGDYWHEMDTVEVAK